MAVVTASVQRAAREPAWSVEAPPDWEDNLARWLDLSYVEGEDRAGFSMLGAKFLQYPNLCTTHSAVGVLTALGQEPAGRSRVIDWIESLRGQAGAYVQSDPSRQGNALDDTYMAATSLLRLGVVPGNVQATISHLLSFQSDDGLFTRPGQSGDSPFSDRVYATKLVVQTLQALGYAFAGSLDRTKQALATYLQSLTPDRAPSFGTDDADAIVAAIESLARMDLSVVPPTAAQMAEDWLHALPHAQPEKGGTVARVNRLLDAAAALNLPEADGSAALLLLSNYVLNYVLPYQRLGESSPSGPRLTDPRLAYEAAKLAARLGLRDPSSEEWLLREMQRHRIDRGWVAFVGLNLNHKSRTTFYAVELANRVGFRGYREDLVEAYFLDALLAEESDLEEVYYGLRGYRLMRGAIDADVREAVEQRIHARAQAADPVIKNLGTYVSLALIATQATARLHDGDRERFAILANELEYRFQDDAGFQSLAYLQALARLRSVLTTSRPLSRDLGDSLGAYRPDTGGYAWLPEIEPSIDATFAAQETLTPLGYPPDNDERLMEFVLSTKAWLGFGYAVQGGNARDSAMAPDFRSTYEALILLEEASERISTREHAAAMALARDM